MKAYDNSKINMPDDHLESTLENQKPVEDDPAEFRKTDIDDLAGAPVKQPVKCILFVDDEEPVRRLFKEALEKFGYQVRLATNGNEALELFRKDPDDLIITDIFMPEKDGHTLILEIKQDFPDAHIFAITGKKFFDTQMELDIAKTLGAIKVFTKPCKLSQLLASIRELSV
jgi:CheY-like chemotaxis protein